MAKKGLSERQKNILAYIKEYVSEWGRPPTIREIGGAVDISSTSVVNYNLTKLKERGLLERDAENSYLVSDVLEAGPMEQLLGSSIMDRIAVGPEGVCPADATDLY